MTEGREVWRTPAEEWRLQEALLGEKTKGGLESFGMEEAGSFRDGWGDVGNWTPIQTTVTAFRVLAREWRGSLVLAFSFGMVGTLWAISLEIPSQQELVPSLLMLGLLLFLEALMVRRTFRIFRDGVAPPVTELLQETFSRLGTGLLLAGLLFSSVFLAGEFGTRLSSVSTGGLSVLLLLVGYLLLVRLVGFAFPALLVEDRAGVSGTLLAGWRASRRVLRLGLGFGIVYLLTWMATTFSLFLSVVIVMEPFRFGSSSVPLLLPLSCLLTGLPTLIGTTDWTLCYLRERERNE